MEFQDPQTMDTCSRNPDTGLRFVFKEPQHLRSGSRFAAVVEVIAVVFADRRFTVRSRRVDSHTRCHVHGEVQHAGARSRAALLEELVQGDGAELSNLVQHGLWFFAVPGASETVRPGPLLCHEPPGQFSVAAEVFPGEVV
ncbi:hypothetical protein PG997_015267 [Apiospora hydei]|uniref:Uncharacterized protein n=1 Tax=Apiospora hydei TaxID=1337664 RepID=A0ABR1UQ56_9PEZI